MENDIRKNGEGYSDPTAYKAIKRTMERDKDCDMDRFHKLLYAIRDICELADFGIEERLVLRDKRTGKIWR